jgi:peptide/nickel transport system substrate-binding protein
MPSPDLWIGFLQTIDYINPFRGLNDPSFFLYGLLYDYPYSFDGSGSFAPNIITSATHDASGFNWTYTVRQGVYWSDGTQLTAADVAFTWNYDSQNLGSMWNYEPYFNQVVQCSSTTQPHCGAVISPTNPWQVILYFQRPFAAGEDLFGPIVQKAQWSTVDPACAGGNAGCPGGIPYANANPIGTGPFVADPNIYNQFLNALSPGGYIHVSRNPRYHPVGANISGSSDIHIQNIYLRFFSDANSLATNLLSGSIQLAQFSPSTIGPVRGQPNIRVQSGLQVIQEWNEIGISQFDAAGTALNPTRFDINVRRAMAKATNKDYIIQQFYNGQGVRGDSLISPVAPQWWYQPGANNLTYNIQEANRLLNQSGYTTWTGGPFGQGYRQATSDIMVSYQTACYQCEDPPNVTATIPAGTVIQLTLATRPTGDFPEEYATAQYLQQEYARIGIHLILKPETSEDLLAADVYGGAVEMYLWYWSADPDPNYMLSMESSWTLDGWNDNFWNNATYNHYYLAQLADFDINKRIQDVKAAQKINYDMAPYIIYAYPYGEWAMRTEMWSGWGDWNKDPYMQMNAFWGANPLFFNLTCPTCSPPVQNQPPTSPVMHYQAYATWFVNTSLSLTATSSDPEASDTLNYTWDWGDGTTTYCPSGQTVANCTSSGGTTTGTHAWNLTDNYTVRVTVSDGFTAVTTQGPVYVNVTEPPPVFGWLAGLVRDTSGHLIAGAYVSTTPGGATSSTTGINGAYNVTVAPGTYGATAIRYFFTTSTPVSVTITANTTTTHDFALTPSIGWITGTVTNSATNAPIQGAAVYVTTSGGQQTSGSTNAAGQFNVSVEPGTYMVNVSANGFTTQSKAGVQVSSGAVTALTFALVPTSQPETPFSPLVIGAIVAVIVIVAGALLAVYMMRRRKKKEEQEAKIELPPKNP